MQPLLQGIQHEANGGGASDNASCEDVNDKCHVYEAVPSAHVSEVGDPELVLRWSEELPVDQIERAHGGLVRDGCFDGFAMHDAFQPATDNRSGDTAATDRHPFLVELRPTFPHTVDANRADEEVHPLLLVHEDMLDASPDLGFPGVRLGNALGHRFAFRLLAVDLAALAVVCEVGLVGDRAIGGIGPDARCRAGRIDEAFAQPGAIMRGGVGGLLPANETVLDVDRDVSLVAKFRDIQIALHGAVRLGLAFGTCDSPASVGVFLRRLGRLVRPDLIRCLAGLDGVFFVLRVPLAWRRHQAGVDDLPAHGQIARILDRLVQLLEQPIEGARRDQRLAKTPERVGVGDRVGDRQPAKPHLG